jgi:hypothetical protein
VPKCAPVVTDPYRPPVGVPPSDDIELVVNSHKILPTRSEDGVHVRARGQGSKADAQEDPIYSMIDILEHHY